MANEFVARKGLIVHGNVNVSGSNGNITSSQNISASGDIFANKYLLKGNDLAQITTANGIANTISIGDSTTPNQLHLAGTNIFIASNTTSSGNISASKLLANDLTLVGLPDTSENKSLMIDSDGVVSGRTLGSNAFSSTAIGTTTNALTDGNGIADFTFNGSAGATVAVEASQTTITSILATDLVVGEDSETKIDFETANEIHLDADNAQVVNVRAGGIDVTGNVTASGNISASSVVVGGNVSASGNIFGKSLIGADSVVHDNDANSGIFFTSDTIQLKGNNQETALFSTNRVSIGHAVDGPTNISGSTVGILGNVTAAGSVTAASFVGDITGDVTGKADTADAVTNALTVDDATITLNSGTTYNGSAAVTISVKDGGIDSDALASDISLTSLTASMISASHQIYSEGSIFVKNHITASGNISASGTISATSYTGDGSGLSGITTSLPSGVVSSSTQIDGLINDTIAATIVAEIDNDEIPIAKLAADKVTINSGTNLSGGGDVTLGQAITLNVDDAFIKNNTDDATTGILTAAGLNSTTHITSSVSYTHLTLPTNREV